MINLKKLLPADSWHPENWDAMTWHWMFSTSEGEANLQFIKLARLAFDVMMRRKWWPVPRVGGGWTVHFTKGSAERWMMEYSRSHQGDGCPKFDDPYTALIEADKWYRENVGGV